LNKVAVKTSKSLFSKGYSAFWLSGYGQRYGERKLIFYKNPVYLLREIKGYLKERQCKNKDCV
jgi:hypothetical protein